MRYLAYVLAIACVFAAEPPPVRLHPVATGFQSPLDIRFDASGRMFVVEQRGTIRIVKNGAVLPGFFLDWRSQVSCCGERGLLGLALSPSFERNGVFYINYTDRSGSTVVARLRTSASNADTADPASAQEILRVAQPFENHNGGNLVFGPDGYLYIGLGDGGSGGDPQNNAQRNNVLLGKMLRINVEGQDLPVPPDNPFVTTPGYAPEIWATGLRNPWRYSFDRETKDFGLRCRPKSRRGGELPACDQRRGENYGWRRMEGLDCYPEDSSCDRTGLILPVIEYPRSQAHPSLEALCTAARATRGCVVFISMQTSPAAIYGLCSARMRESRTIWSKRRNNRYRLSARMPPGNYISLRTAAERSTRFRRVVRRYPLEGL